MLQKTRVARMPKQVTKADPDIERDENEALLPVDLSETLERAEALLIEAFELLKQNMPPVLACAIATQIIEDLALLETSPLHSH